MKKTTLVLLTSLTAGMTAHAAKFEISGIPSKVAAQSAVSNFSVRFAPSAHGRVLAALEIANDSTVTPYVVNFQGYAWTATQTLSQVFGPAAGGNIVTLTNVPFGCGGNDITNIVMNGVNITNITGQGTNWVSFVASPGTAGQTVSITVQSVCKGNTVFGNVYTYRPAGVIGGGAGVRWMDYRVNFFGTTSTDPNKSVRYPTNTAADGESRWTYYDRSLTGTSIELMSTNGLTNGVYVNISNYASDYGADGIKYPSYDWIAQNPATNFIYCLIVASNYVVITNLPGSSYYVDFIGAYYGGGSSWKFNTKLFQGVWSAAWGTAGGNWGTNASATWQNPGGAGNNADATNAAYYSDRIMTWSDIAPSNKALTIVQWPGSGGTYNNYVFLNCMRIRGFEPDINGGTGVEPSTGPFTGGITVAISGSNLCNGTAGDVTSVKLCGVEAAVMAVHGGTQIVVTAGASGYGLGDVLVRSVEYGLTIRSNAFTYQPAASATLAIRGNSQLITNGANPSAENGTDFGSRTFAAGQKYTNTFVFRNEGALALTNFSWTTNGVGAAAFAVRGVPSVLAPGNASNVLVVFSPAASTLYSASLVITNNAGTDNPFTMNLSGQGVPNEQTITFPAIADQVLTNVVGLAATASSGLDVRFEVASGNASISGATNLSFGGVGFVTILAIQDGNESYAYAATSRTFNVTRMPVAFEATGLNPTYDGDPKPVEITSIPAGKTIVTNYLTSGSPATDAGTYFISAEVSDFTHAGYAVFTQVIAKASQTLSGFTPTNGSVFTTLQTATLNATSDRELTPSFEVVGGPGSLNGNQLFFTSSGSVTVRVTQAGTGNYLAAPPLTNIYTVSKTAQQPISFLPATPMTFGTTNHLSASGGSGSGAWSFAVASGAGAIADVTNVVITSGTGTVTFVATKAADDLYLAAAVTVQVACAKAAQRIEIDDPGVVPVTNVVGLSATVPSGLPVTFSVVSGPGRLSEGTNLSFTAAGSVMVRVLQAGDDNYLSAENSRIIPVSPLDAIVTLHKLNQFFDGDPKPVSAATVPEGLTVLFTYDGDTNAPSAVGSYSVSAATYDPIYDGTATGTLVIAYEPKMEVQTLTGQVVPNGAPANPALGTDFGTVATNALAEVVLSITNSGLGDLVVSGIGTNGVGVEFFIVQGMPEVVSAGSASNITVRYEPRALGAHALSLSVSHNGTNTPYVLNFSGTGIEPGEIFLVGSSMSFEGRYPDAVILGEATFIVANTNPAASAYGYTNEIRYGAAADWLAIVGPTGYLEGAEQQIHTGTVASVTGRNAGEYRATNWIVSGEAANSPVPMLVSLTVHKGTQHIEFAQIPDQVTTNTLGLSAPASSGLPVSFRVVNSPATLADGTNLSFTGAGEVRVVASQPGNSNWMAAVEVTNIFTVTKAPATVSITNLSYVYDGGSKSASAATVPEGLTVVLRYEVGGEWSDKSAPSGAGNYPVKAEIKDAIFAGEVTGTLSIAKANQTINFPQIGDQFITNQVTLRATASSGSEVEFTNLTAIAVIEDGTNLSFVGNGECVIVARAEDDPNYHPAPEVTNTFTVFKAIAQIYVSALQQTYNGEPRPVLVATVPDGLDYDLTYDGDTNAPVNGGRYTVVVSIVDADYEGVQTNTLTVSRAAQTLEFSNPGDQWATNRLGLSATASSGLNPVFTVLSGPAVITDGTNMTFTRDGQVALRVSQPGNVNWLGVTNDTVYFNVSQVPATIMPNNGPFAGGNFVTVSNGYVGTVTNVLVGSVGVVPVESGHYWFTIVMPPAANAGLVDFTVQTSDNGETALPGAYTYNPVGYIGGMVPGPYAWTNLGTGVDDAVNALAHAGAQLYAGGGFWDAGGVTSYYAASWNGAAWTNLGSGMDQTVYALWTDGANLFAGGGFTSAGGRPASRIARWNGSSWTNLGSGLNNNVLALDHDGLRLYAGGTFRTAGVVRVERIAMWDGASWTNLGAGLNGSVYALAHNGSHLFAAGGFSTAGVVAASRIAMWDGATWTNLGSGMNNAVYSLKHDGTNLYAGGYFTTAGGVAARGLAKWDGTNWSAVGGSLDDGGVCALDWDGTNLFAGGWFTSVGGVAAKSIACWDGTSWTNLGTGTDDNVLALKQHNGSLFAGGGFTEIGGVSANRIAQWKPSIIETLGVTPPSGSYTGGYQVVISGSNLCNGADVTNVTLCGVSVSGISSQSATQIVVVAGAAAAGLGDVRVFSVSYGETVKSNAFTYLMPQFRMLGTNFETIVNNNTPDTADGTDFGAAIVGFETRTNTFSITNSGNTALVISGVTTSGVGAAAFRILDPPAAISALSAVNFSVVFTPQGGRQNAALNFVHNGTNTPFVMNVTAFGLGGNIDLATNRLTFAATYLGANPADQLVWMGNNGVSVYTYTNILAYGSTAAGWLTVRPAQGTVADGAATRLTNVVDITGLNAGTHWATNRVTALDATNSPQLVVVELVVAKADQTISFPALGDQETTNRIGLAATATSGLPVSFAVGSGPAAISGGTNLSFTGAGVVSVIASQAGDTNWNAAPDVTNTFNVSKAVASVTLNNLNQTYDGTPRVVTATTAPAGLTVDITYDGNTWAPTNAGSYAITGVVNEVMYQGSQTGTLVVGKANQTITFPPIGDQFWTNRLGLAATASSGLPVSFATNGGPAEIAGGTNLSFTGYGVVSILASQLGDANWNAAPEVTNTFTVFGPALIVLGTNGEAIASGEAPNAAKGMVYDTVFFNYPCQTNVFTITNAGTGAWRLLGLVTNGSPAFRVMECPATLSTGAAAPWAVAFDTGVIGIHTAQVVLAYDGTDTPFTLNLRGTVEPDLMSIWMATQKVEGIERNVFSRYDWTVWQALTDLRDILNQTNLAGIIVRFGGYTGYNPAFTNGNLVQFKADLDYLLDVFPLTNTVYANTNNVGQKSYIDQYGNYFTTTQPDSYDPLPFTNTYTVILEAGRYTAAAGILQTLENVELVTRYQRIRILASDNTRTQAITFAAIPDQTYPDIVHLGATASSGLPVSYTNLPGNPVQWLSATSIGFTAVGQVDIVAMQTGNVDYLPARAITNSFQVGKGNQTITFPALADTYWLNATGLAATAASGLPVSFAVLSGPGSISDGTNLSFTGVGPVQVVATQAGNANWNPAPDVTNLVNALGPEFILRGTNGAEIANNAAASVTEGTDFGAAIVNVETRTHTFTITNRGTYALAVSGVTTSGAGAAAFSILDAPSVIAVASAVQFSVRFTPLGGQHDAAFSFAFNGTNTPFIVNVAGFGLGGNIDLATNRLTFAATYLGANPADQLVWMGNNGVSAYTYTNILAYGSTAAGWLTVRPALGTVANGAATRLTNVVDITGLNAGTHWATNRVTALDATNSPQLVVVALVVAKADQTISFPAIPDQLATNQVGLAATATSGLPVGFSVLSGPAMISGGTNLSFTSYGVVSIVASQAGDTNWNAAPSVTNTFNVNRATQSELVFTPTSPQTYGTTNTLSTTGGSGTGAVSYAVLSGAGAIISPNRLSALAGTGTVTVTATKAADDFYNPQTVTALVNCIRANQTITFDPIADPFWTNRLGLAATASSGLGVSFAVGAGPAAIVGGTNLSFSGYGTVSIVASQPGDFNYNAAPDVTNTFQALGPEFVLRGTNGAVIASGAAATPTNGTDFGALIVGVQSLTNTFSITNNGTARLTISGVTTSGAGAACFAILNPPAAISASSAVAIRIVFTPLGAQQNAAFTFTYDGTNTPYVLNVAGFGLGGGIKFLTNRLDFAAVYVGTNPAAQFMGVTNVGVSGFTYSNTWTYSSGASGWLGVAPATGTVAQGAQTQLTNAVNIAGVNAGTYYATNMMTAPDATNTPQAYIVALTVAKADQTISFPVIADQWTTNLVGLAATSGSGLPVSFAVTSGPAVISGGTNLSFNAAGVVSIVASQAGDTNWNAAPSVTNTFTVTRSIAPVTLHDLSQIYATGLPRVVTATTVPTGLVVDITYDGGATPPVNAGRYAVTGVINDIMYQGWQTGTLVVAKADQAINFPAIADQWTTNRFGLAATTGSGLPVSFAVGSGPGVITDGTNLAFTTDGLVSIVASQAGTTNWNAAPSVTNTFMVTKAIAAVTLLDLAQTYTGTPRVVTATTVPSGLGVDFTYNGSTNAPINAGSYAVTGTVNDLMYQGWQTGTLVVAKANQTINFPAIPDQAQTSTVALAATASSGLPVAYEVVYGPCALSYSGTLSFNGAGPAAVAAQQAGDGNWNPASGVTNAFMIRPVVMMLATPTGGGVLTPAAGAHVVDYNTPVAIGVAASAGFRFLWWEAPNGVVLGSLSASDTTATLVSNGLVIAHFAQEVSADATVNIVDWQQYGAFRYLVSFEICNTATDGARLGPTERLGIWSNTMYWLVNPQGTDPETGYPFVNVSGQIAAQVPGGIIDPGVCVTVTNIRMYSISSNPPPNLDWKFWAERLAATNRVDTDGDGMPDTWEDGFPVAVNRYNPFDGGLDYDGDRMWNEWEWISNTDPTDDHSFLYVASILRRVAGQKVIEWPSAAERVYSVYFATNIMSGFQRLATGLPATPPVNVWTDSAPSSVNGIYGIQVEIGP